MASKAAPPPTWEKLLDAAMELSAQQHEGKPELGRLCQPKFKECINALSFKANDGTDMIMKVTEDPNGQRIKREICSFNTHGDVRTCVDWDTAQTHREPGERTDEFSDSVGRKIPPKTPHFSSFRLLGPERHDGFASKRISR
jgi:hypothetical protein